MKDLFAVSFFALYAAVMRLFTSFAIGLSLVTASAFAADPGPTGLTEEHRADLRCAAAFAIVASEQERGAPMAGWPPLGLRGMRFFADVGARVVSEAGLTREQVRDVLTADVAAMQQQAVSAADPAAPLSAVMPPCIVRLDKAVPPLRTPDLLQCTAILGLAYEDVHAREGLSPAARDLATLASVLSSREREALVAAGKTGDAADRTLAEARDAMLAELSDGAGGVQKYDIAHCYDLARPNEKSHY